MPLAYTLLVFHFTDITTYKIAFYDRNQCFVNVFQGMRVHFAYFARVKFLMYYFKYLTDAKFSQEPRCVVRGNFVELSAN